MIGQMAIALALPAFNDLGHSVTFKCFFFLFGSFSLPIFYVLRKNEENLSIRSLNFFAKCTIEFRYFSSSFICAAVPNAS